MVAHQILVLAQGPLVLGLKGLGIWGHGLTKKRINTNNSQNSGLRVLDQVELRKVPHRLLHCVLQRGAPLHAPHDRDGETPDPGPAEGSENSDATWSR